MTNNEIAKALDHCFLKHGKCPDCPMYKCEIENCIPYIIKEAIASLRTSGKGGVQMKNE